MDSTAAVFTFYLIAGVTLGSALMMVLLRNIVHSALYMILSFVGVAALYLTLNAEFLAAVQIIVYAGAIGIFIVFGVMLTQRSNIKETNLFNKQKFIGALVAMAFLGVSAFMVLKTQWPVASVAPPENSIPVIANLMLNDFVIPFEVAAVLLLVAMLGAILIAKEVKKSQ